MSDRGNVQSGKCQVGEVSGRGSVRQGIVRSGNVRSGKCPVGEVSVGEVSVGEVSVGEMSVGEVSVGEVSRYHNQWFTAPVRMTHLQICNHREGLIRPNFNLANTYLSRDRGFSHFASNTSLYEATHSSNIRY